MSAKTRLAMVVKAQAYYTSAASYRLWAFNKYAEQFREQRTWDGIHRTETELLRASEVERLAERALRMAEFKYLTFRPLGGPSDFRRYQPRIPKPARLND